MASSSVPLAVARTPGDNVYQPQVLVLDPQRQWWLWGWVVEPGNVARGDLKPLTEDEAKALLSTTLFTLLAKPQPLSTDIAARPPQIAGGVIRY